MGVSLVTIVGRGKFGDNSYVKTRYTFPDGSKSDETTLFSKVLLEKYKGELESVIIAGTETSSWSAILPDDREDEGLAELLLKLYQIEKEKRPIEPEDLMEVEHWIKNIYECAVHILPAQKSDITKEEDALSVYSQLFSYVKKGSQIVFDITSGFRYLPLLIFQNLQIYSGDIKPADVKLIYAELGGDEARVRDVSLVWNAAEVTKELHAFKTSFDGYAISKRLKEKGYAKLSDWIEDFTDYIQKNYVMLCDRAFFARLKNTLERDFSDADAIKSIFVRETVSFLQKEIVDKFDFNETRLSHYLFVLSAILNKRNLFTQAIIALRESLYTRLFEKYDPKQIKVYISEEELRKKAYYQAFLDTIKYGTSYSENIENLRKMRNSIAHAGADRNKKLSEDFNYYYKAVEEVFKKVEK